MNSNEWSLRVFLYTYHPVNEAKTADLTNDTVDLTVYGVKVAAQLAEDAHPT